MVRAVYIRRLLELYTSLPDTPNGLHLEDRLLAAALYDKNVPLHLLQEAFLLGTARRRFRSPAAPPLQAIRSLYYFLPILQEITDQPSDPQYLSCVADRLSATFGITFLPLWNNVNALRWRSTRSSRQ